MNKRKPHSHTPNNRNQAGGQQKPKPQTGLILILVSAALLGAFFFIYIVSGSQGFPAFVSAQQAYELYQQEGVFVLDVREPFEWDEVHIPNTTLIPLGELAGRVHEVPRDAKIVVVCRSGNRSQEGRDILKRAGFENVTSMNGGVIGWGAAGYPTTP